MHLQRFFALLFALATCALLVTGRVAAAKDLRPEKGFQLSLDPGAIEASVELRQAQALKGLTATGTGSWPKGGVQDSPELLEKEIERADRYGGELTVGMIDVDRFRVTNHNIGHHAGDQVLEHVGRVLRESTRLVDTAARYGG
ncbi:diguanylate cyclase, partial [Planctomycetota bacterium]